LRIVSAALSVCDQLMSKFAVAFCPRSVPASRAMFSLRPAMAATFTPL
jgi:hypothetical protein